MNQNSAVPQTDAPDEELVGYLDGELAAVDRARVEKRLAEDAAFRSRLKLLQRTWDALDVLERAGVNETFTRTTVELVATKAAEDVDREQSRQVQRRKWGWVVWGSVWAVSAAAGWALLATVLSGPDRQLVRDLPVIERVDEYRNADSLAFVQALEKSGLFASEAESHEE